MNQKNQNLKLMVVDNEIDICNFVKSFFGMRGYEVLIPLNGDEALARLENDKPDLVILDVAMRTQREGIEYLSRIKKKAPNIKVIMVTGIEDDATIEEARRLGADDYITKPLVLEYLETTVFQKIKALGLATGSRTRSRCCA